MKIVFCHYRYFVSSGPERYLFQLSDLLSEKGDRAIPFSIRYAQNEPSPYDSFFVNPPGGPDQIFYKELHLSLGRKLKVAADSVYSFEARRKLEALINREKPDLVQMLKVTPYLSFGLIDAVKTCGLPVVCRLSDYHLICPEEHCLRDNRICEKCGTSLFYSVLHRCVQNSVAVSAVRCFSLLFHRFRKSFERVDGYIAPSRFLRDKMIGHGLDPNKIFHVPSFINVKGFEPSYGSEGYIVYVGRLSLEKGVQDLVKAFSRIKTNAKLLVLGDDKPPPGRKVLDTIGEYDGERIKFLGHRPLEEVKKIVRNALFTVSPSLWYENNPNSVAESFALGKPVIASRIGSMGELVADGKTGLLFEPGHIGDLAEKMRFLLERPNVARDMGYEARSFVEKEYNAELHYERLMEVYRKIGVSAALLKKRALI